MVVWLVSLATRPGVGMQGRGGGRWSPAGGANRPGRHVPLAYLPGHSRHRYLITPHPVAAKNIKEIYTFPNASGKKYKRNRRFAAGDGCPRCSVTPEGGFKFLIANYFTRKGWQMRPLKVMFDF